jgi:hypothetical protein
MIFKSHVQFAKLVFEKYGYGAEFTNALATIGNEGGDVLKIRRLVCHRSQLYRHQILLYKGDMERLAAYSDIPPSQIVRELVHNHCELLERQNKPSLLPQYHGNYSRVGGDE